MRSKPYSIKTFVPSSSDPPDPSEFYRPFPYRSPLMVGDAVADIIRGKVVCDIGCAEGDLALQFMKHAKHVIGFERDACRYQHAVTAGVDVMIADYNINPLPIADFYYSWGPNGPSNITVTKMVFEQHPNATMIIGGMKRGKNSYVHKSLQIWPGYLIRFDYHEVSAIPDKFPHKGTWLLAVLRKHATDSDTGLVAPEATPIF